MKKQRAGGYCVAARPFFLRHTKVKPADLSRLFFF
jgi:hypothetical protein